MKYTIIKQHDGFKVYLTAISLPLVNSCCFVKTIYDIFLVYKKLWNEYFYYFWNL